NPPARLCEKFRELRIDFPGAGLRIPPHGRATLGGVIPPPRLATNKSRRGPCFWIPRTAGSWGGTSPSRRSASRWWGRSGWGSFGIIPWAGRPGASLAGRWWGCAGGSLTWSPWPTARTVPILPNRSGKAREEARDNVDWRFAPGLGRPGLPRAALVGRLGAGLQRGGGGPVPGADGGDHAVGGLGAAAVAGGGAGHGPGRHPGGDGRGGGGGPGGDLVRALLRAAELLAVAAPVLPDHPHPGDGTRGGRGAGVRRTVKGTFPRIPGKIRCHGEPQYRCLAGPGAGGGAGD